MPIYAYRCDHCGHAKDVLQKLSDPMLSICPACGTASFRKQVTAAGFQLKGSGWYVTDFRGGNGAAKAATDGSKVEKPADTTSSDAAKTESAPAPAAASSGESASGGGCGSSCAGH